MQGNDPPSYGAFLYPDLRTAVVGRFSPSSRLLLAGRATEVRGISDFGALKRITFDEPDIGEASPVYKYDPPNHYRLQFMESIKALSNVSKLNISGVRENNRTGT